jgi:hypothetical protein
MSVTTHDASNRAQVRYVTGYMTGYVTGYVMGYVRGGDHGIHCSREPVLAQAIPQYNYNIITLLRTVQLNNI